MYGSNLTVFGGKKSAGASRPRSGNGIRVQNSPKAADLVSTRQQSKEKLTRINSAGRVAPSNPRRRETELAHAHAKKLSGPNSNYFIRQTGHGQTGLNDTNRKSSNE